MNKKSYLPSICLFYTLVGALLIFLVSNAHAYNRYNDGCQNCHGSFSSGMSPKGTDFDYHENNKQEMHRNAYAMATDCTLCHTNGDKDNPYIGSSSGHQGSFNVGCVGCHGREEDAGNDSLPGGRGAGLRQHHFNAGTMVCFDCHNDANPQRYTPVGEQVVPAYYGSNHTNADGPCNPVSQHETNENWDHYNFEGLDNDGDGLYDGNDPDCQPDTLVVLENNPLATNANASDNIAMQKLHVLCSDDANGECTITSVSVHDTQVSTTGIIDSLEIHLDTDQNLNNGTLGSVTVSDWDGEPTVADMTSIPFEDRTVDNQQGTNVLVIYNLNASSDGSTMQSQVTAIGVFSPDNGASGMWDSNILTISSSNSAPVLSVSEPNSVNDTVTVGDSYNIKYSLNDPDNEVTVAFYYDEDNSGLDGTMIQGACASAPEGNNRTCAWDTGNMPLGTYFVYGISDDGLHSPVSDYSPGLITINSPSCPDNDNDGYVDCDGSCDPGGLLCGECNDNENNINPSSAEICDNLDNNCDGSIDENLTQPTSCGVGECGSTGTETCTAGTWGDDTCTPGAPSAEVCDGSLDENCDGTVDENCDCSDGETRSTTCGVGECGSTGTETCTAGVWGGDTCTPGAPSAEVCDNLDNDCDGTVDGITQDTSCGVGECAGNTGIETCTAGAWGGDTCDPLAGALPEGPSGDATCSDTLDNDCDGDTDDGDLDCQGACQETGDISILSGQTLGGDQINLTSIVTTNNAANLVYTVTEDGSGSCDVNPNGTYLEAEDFFQQVADPGTNNHQFTIVAGGTDNGGAHIENAVGTTGSAPTGYRVDIGPINFPATATYNFWLRLDNVGTGNSAFVGVDGVVVGALTNTASGQWYWTNNIQSGTGTNSISVSAGPRVINIWTRESTQVDGVYFTTVAGTPPGLSGSAGQYTGSMPTGATVLDPFNCGDGGTTLFTGNHTEAQTVDTAGWTDGNNNLTVEGDDGTCGTPLTPASDTFIFESQPAVETDCNDGTDNDGDGQTDCADSDCEGTTRPTTCGVGECSGNTGVETCTAGSWGGDTCDPLAGATAETCDNLDNNCDGSIDENLTQPTTCGVGECAGNTGEETCTAGTWGNDTCDPLAGATPEVCDGSLDEDCDGTVDDGCDCIDGETRPTTCGVGECGATGTETCTAGTWGGDTCTPGTPSAEVCDNLDNDCDGTVDGITQATSCGVGECAANTGIETCTAGAWGGDTCNPLAGATAETCDNLDNDCDGGTDEDLTRSTTCGVGECAGNTGTETCTAGTWGGDTCDPLAGASPEVCDDTLDNDCDGDVDTADTDDCGCSQYTRTSDCNGDPSCQWNNQLKVCESITGCTPTGLPDDNCDGVDDDCDGTPDDEYAAPTTTCGVGECAGNTGLLECQNGSTVDTCDPLTGATTEVCDNLDNDCDGGTDEDLTRSTTCGAGECGSTGVETCTAGVWVGDTCTPGTPSAEVCDNLDNNCDGSIDESLTRSTSCGVGECIGNTGEETCTAGAWGDDTCDPLAGAIPEVCDDAGMLDEDCDGLANDNDPKCDCVPTGVPDNNCDGIDDDCDGTPDDEYAPTPTVCGDAVCTNSGQLECQAGTLVDTCVPLPPVEPTDVTCDGQDGDCDGSIDEDYVVDDTCGAGVCRTNNTPSSCAGGIETPCQPGTPTETPEATCIDGLDNDCDGAVDGADSDCGGAYIPPPVRQELGVADGLFNNLEEPDCRVCHENPDQFPVEDVSIPDRHHLLVDSTIPSGSLLERPELDPPLWTDDGNNDNNPDTNYACENCHPDDPATQIIEFPVTRNCLVCHVQIDGTGSVHHLTATAQGTDSPIGDPNVGDCTPCHGTIVDDTGDGHVIPTYDPTPETPTRSGGNGLPLNSRGNGTGACNYCHDDGSSPEGILVETNMDTHHNTGLGPPVEDPLTSEKCAWCHDFDIPFEAQIRICENCHGQDSLHNIQADSDGNDVIEPGIELPNYGHIGNPDDCWGCHGFGASSTAPQSGPVVPTISSISESVLTEGTNTTVTLSGSAFTNMDEGAELTSHVVLIAADGSSTTLTPDAISQGSITVTIPGSLAKGNYKLKTAKLDKESNPIVISIKPGVSILEVRCRKKSGELTIGGTGFSEKREGTDAYLNVEVNGESIDITSWTDTQITGLVSSCPRASDVITVNALFGSTTW